MQVSFYYKLLLYLNSTHTSYMVRVCVNEIRQEFSVHWLFFFVQLQWSYSLIKFSSFPTKPSMQGVRLKRISNAYINFVPHKQYISLKPIGDESMYPFDSHYCTLLTSASYRQGRGPLPPGRVTAAVGGGEQSVSSVEAPLMCVM